MEAYGPHNARSMSTTADGPDVSGLWDAHTHLQDEAFEGRVGEVLQRAAAAGVGCVVVAGARPSDWDRVAALAREHAMVRPAYGVHPLYVAELSPGWEADLTARLEADPRASVGEIGLDRAVAPRDDALQERVFRTQLAIARRLGRPATIHCRRAWDTLTAALEAAGPFPAGLVFHSYGGGADMVGRLSRLGGWFSFSGTLTWPAHRRGPMAARAAPADRLLVETDSPDLPPFVDGRPWPGPNEPANLPRVVAALAAVRGGAPAEWGRITAANAASCFGGMGAR